MLRSLSLAGVLVLLSACASTVMTTVSPDESLALFNSADPADANLGYRELFEHGVVAIPHLLGNLASDERWPGDAYADLRSSIDASDPSRTVISLYLVEAIRLNHDHPHRAPILTAAVGTPDEIETRAVEAYRAWWAGLPSPAQADVRASANPLAGTGIAWF